MGEISEGDRQMESTRRLRRDGRVKCAVALAVVAAIVAVGGIRWAGHGGDGEAAASSPTTAPREVPATTVAPPAPPPTVTDGPAEPPAPAAAPEPVAAVPTDSEEYATAAFNAWLQGDDGRLRQLANDAVADFLASRTPDEPGQWSGPTSDGAAGSIYYSWTQPGAELVVRVASEPAFLGQEHAVLQAFFTVPEAG